MKNILIVLLSISLTSFTYNSGENTSRTKETRVNSYQSTVVICTGGSSKRYHKNHNCTGLRNCRATTINISIDDARKKGRTPCKTCYG